MSKRTKSVVLGVSVLIVLYVLLGSVLARTLTGEGAYRQLGVYSEVLARVKNDYVEEPNIPAVSVGALHGLLEALDPYSSYLSAREYSEYQRKRVLERGEIGGTLSKRFGYLSIVGVLPGSPADRAGLRTGDLIESINDFTTREMSVEQARILLSGEPGTIVKLSVVRTRRTEPQTVELVRAVVPVPPVETKPLEGDISYIKVAAFSAGKAAEIRNRLEQLQRAGAYKIVLDLRNCAAGEASEAIETARLFLERGLIASLRGQHYPREDFSAEADKVVWRGPMAVLINVGTAGPAELVAAAILENQRGDVIGEKSYGMGSVQRLIPLDDGSALILSVAKYYSPSGKAVQDTAVTPNVAVGSNEPEDVAVLDEGIEARPSQVEEERETPPKDDEALQRAIERLRGAGAQKKAA